MFPQSEISVEKRNAIAYQLLTYMAMNRKPDFNFLMAFAKSDPKVIDHFLKEYTFDDLREFTESVFKSGFELNLQVFDEEFNSQVENYKEREGKKEKSSIGFKTQSDTPES